MSESIEEKIDRLIEKRNEELRDIFTDLYKKEIAYLERKCKRLESRCKRFRTIIMSRNDSGKEIIERHQLGLLSMNDIRYLEGLPEHEYVYDRELKDVVKLEFGD